MDRESELKSKLHKKLPSVRAQAVLKGVLTHEVDQGSPCLKCGPGCKGFSLHFWRKICANCLCPREEHDINPQQEDKQVLVNKILFHPEVDQLNVKKPDLVDMMGGSPRRPRTKLSNREDNDSPSILRKTDNYTWVPKDCSLNAAKAFFEGLPENKRPVNGTQGNRYWQKQKIRQLPGHDLDLIYCNDLSNEECKQMELFVKIRKEKFLGKGKVVQKTGLDKSEMVCGECNGHFKIGEAVVFADKLSAQHYHPACFTCCECSEILVEMIYFTHDDKLYCGRHHAEKLKPRCGACDEVIFCAEYTRAEDQNWHINHFSCLNCDMHLAGKHYMMKDGQPYCLECYERYFASTCQQCGNTIPLDHPRLSHDGLYWHAKPECFRCYICEKSLLEEPFLPKNGNVFCGRPCLKKYKSLKK